MEPATFVDLSQYGITDVTEVVYNPSYGLLYKEELRSDLEGYEKGQLSELGAVNVMTGIFTGRSPKDKYIVKDELTENTIWWDDQAKSSDNKPLSQENWKALKDVVTTQLSGKRLFVVDTYCGADEETRVKVRFIVEVAWQAHFVKNMFIRPTEEELVDFKPDFIVMNGAKTTNKNWEAQGLHSENFVDRKSVV